MPQEGDIAINRRDGGRAIFTQGQWVREKGGAQQGDASQRGRLAMGMGPMVQAQEDMTAAERSGNPLQKDWGATVLGSIGLNAGPVQWQPFDDIAKAWGGNDYQGYVQAAKAFESQLMPIMSGAAVSPSEAQRQIRAALPELGDSPEILEKKSRTRQMMLNGAAKMMAAQLPYPNVPTYGVNTQSVPTGQGVRRMRFNAKTGKIE